MTNSDLELRKIGPSDITLLIGLSTSLLTIAMGPLIPGLIRGGTLMLIAIGVIWCVALPGRTEQNRSLMFWPILLVLLGVLPSLFNSINLQASQETLAFLPIGFVLFLGICIAGAAGRKTIAIAALISIFLIALEGTLQYLFTNGLFSGRSMAGNRVRSSMPHPNDIAILPMLLPIAVIGIRHLPRPLAVATGSILVPLVVFTVITSWSRNAWIGLTVTGIALAIWKGGLIRISVGCGLIIAMLLVAIDVADMQNRLLSLADPMRDGRIGLWLAAMAMFLEHPFTGIGAGTFGFAYPDVVSMVRLPEGYQAESGFIPWAHNMYLELLAEYGLPGFLAYAIVTTWLMGKLLAQAVFGERRASGDRTDDLRNWAIALLISWSAILVMAMFDLTFYKHWVVYLYWMLVGLGFSIVARVQGRTRPEVTPSQED
ncbi:MAG: hypothetical protein CMJ40_04745 [Phycisphaerae bacterium]|nr:hypothetical protein [Phycisphaerae bacterium]